MVLPSSVRLAALLLAIAPAAFAQTAPVKPGMQRANPSDSNAPVPPMVYRSAFAKAPPPTDVPLVSWQQANDAVWRIGGWRAYAREASQPEASASKPAPTAPAAPMTK